MGLHRAFGVTEQPGGFGDAEVLPVTQDDDGAPARWQPGQRAAHVEPILRTGVRDCCLGQPLDRRLPAPEGTSRLVDRRAHQHLAGVGIDTAVPVQSRPSHVDLRQRGLDEILSAMPVAAQQVRGPTHHQRSCVDVLTELAVAIPHSGLPSVTAQYVGGDPWGCL
jgi:hypothetical protein